MVYGYCLAEDKNEADAVVKWSQSKKVNTSFYRMGSFRHTRSLGKKRNGCFGNILDYQLEDDDEKNSHDEKENEMYSTDAITFSRICHITSDPIDKASVTMETIDSMLIARGHIIICGISHNFIDFIKPLRAKHLPKNECLAIVVLCKELPDDKLWNTIAFFDQIYLVQGDPMNKSDLKRAGIRFAKKVVILAPNIHEISQFTNTRRKNNPNIYIEDSKTISARKLTREEEDLLDSKTIFKYNMISKMKKDIFIIVELISPKNVSFLYNKGRTQNDEYQFIKSGMNIDGTAIFATGEVYFSSIMDNLITQAYYNPSLLSVLKKLILGEDQSIYKKTPLNKYKDIVSSNLYIIDIPVESKNETDNTYTMNDGSKSQLLFKDIFHMLLKKNIVVIGVYRANISNNAKINDKNNSHIFYYVVTSPQPSFKLSMKDKLFVLSQSFQSDIIFMHNIESKTNNHEDVVLNQYENMYFKNANKKEEKKEITRPTDHMGEIKIKEVNALLKDTISCLEELRIGMRNAVVDIDLTIRDAIKDKIEKLSGGDRVKMAHEG